MGIRAARKSPGKGILGEDQSWGSLWLCKEWNLPLGEDLALSLPVKADPTGRVGGLAMGIAFSKSGSPYDNSQNSHPKQSLGT